MELHVDDEKNIAYIKLSGLLCKEVILNAFELAVSDKRYKKGMGRLWDFGETDLSSLDAETITAMAQSSLRFPTGINDVKVSFVTSGDLCYGLSRMFEISSNAKTPICVFRAMNQAEKWMTE